MRTLTVGVAALVIAAQQAEPAGGQTIATRLGLTLGDADGPGSFQTKPEAFARLSDGRIIVVELNQVPVVFAPNGRFLRQLGSRGEGPGEFSGYVRDVRVRRGDTIVVSNGARVSLFDPELHFMRAAQLGGLSYATFASTGEGYLAGPLISTGPVTDRVHVLNGSFETVRTFMPETVRISGLHAVRVEPGDSSHLWTILTPQRQNQHRVERWSIAGEFAGAIDSVPAWWSNNGSKSFGPSIAGIRQVGQVLWVASRVPVTNAAAAGPGRGEVSMRDIEWDRLFNSYLEAYDVPSKKLIAVLPIPGYLVGFLDDGHFVKYVVDSNDIPRLQIWDMVLKR